MDINKLLYSSNANREKNEEIKGINKQKDKLGTHRCGRLPVIIL